jgi:cytidylate kinase
LGFEFLDTGAMYRCVTYWALCQGTPLSDSQAVLDLAKSLTIELEGKVIKLNGRDVSEAIRSTEVGLAIGLVADNVEVRSLLSRWQREWASGRNVVTEGRDQGSEVFSDSPCKIFLVASAEERAKRRQEELARRGVELDWQTVLQQQNHRDHQDRTRPVGALRKAPDSIEFTTDGLSLDEVLDHLEQIVRQRLAGLQASSLRPHTPASSGTTITAGPAE